MEIDHLCWEIDKNINSSQRISHFNVVLIFIQILMGMSSLMKC